MTNRTATEIAALIGATVEGDGAIVLTGPAGLEDATPEHISFLANHRYVRSAQSSQAGAILLAMTEPRPNPGAVLLRVENPSKAFATVCALFAPPEYKPVPGIHPRAVIDPTAVLGAGVSVGPGAVIEPGAQIGADTAIGANCYIGHDCRIGARCRLYPNVTLRERCTLGNEVIIHPGAVIGADGFGFDLGEGGATKIPQIGIVRIDDRVEVGANTTIDRARFGQTWIQEGAKIDNLVQIAHNVVVGKHTMIAAQVGISGSTRIGQKVLIAGQAGLTGHIQVGDGAILCAQAGISKDVAPKAMVAGYHARPIREEQRTEVTLRKLPELYERVRRLEKPSPAGS